MVRVRRKFRTRGEILPSALHRTGVDYLVRRCYCCGDACIHQMIVAVASAAAAAAVVARVINGRRTWPLNAL